jgi:hypothetical protein
MNKAGLPNLSSLDDQDLGTENVSLLESSYLLERSSLLGRQPMASQLLTKSLDSFGKEKMIEKEITSCYRYEKF